MKILDVKYLATNEVYLTLFNEKYETYVTYLSDIWRAVRRGDTTAETDDDEVCKEYTLFKGEVDVCLKGTSFPAVRRLRKIHPEDPSGIVSSTDQPDSTSKFLWLVISVEVCHRLS